MALSLNECMMAVNGGRPLRHGQLLALREPGGYGLGGKKKKKKYLAALAAQAEQEAQAAISAITRDLQSQLSRGRTIQSQLQSQIIEAEAATRSMRDAGSFSLVQQLTDVQFDVQSAIQEAESAEREFQTRVQAARSRGGNWATPLREFAEATKTSVAQSIQRAQRASASIASVVARIRAQQQDVQSQAEAVAAAEAARIRAEQERLRLEAEERQRQDQLAWEREQARLERERQLRMEEREYEASLERERQEREAAIRAEAAAARAGETSFQQALLQMEQQRAQAELEFRREQAAREAEREARREEQEAMLQQLLLMQELGPAAGMMPGMMPGAMPGMMPGAMPGMMPGAMPGMPFGAPQAPGAFPYPGQAVPYQYGLPPGMPGAVAAYPGQTAPVPVAPFQGYPGATMAPGMPGYGPPAFAQPQPYMQSGPAYAPQQPAPPGMEWASFNPANEMFGMGHYGQQAYKAARGVRRLPFAGSAQAAGLGAADQPVANPRLKGARVELGYNVYGPSLDANQRQFYTFEAPDGASWMVFAEQVVGPTATPQKDPRTNRIIYDPGSATGETEFDWRELQKGLQSAIGTGVQAYQQIALTRELERGAREQRRTARSTGTAPVYSSTFQALATGRPAGVQAPGQGGRVPGWVWGAGIAALGVGAAVALGGRRKKR